MRLYFVFDMRGIDAVNRHQQTLIDNLGRTFAEEKGVYRLLVPLLLYSSTGVTHHCKFVKVGDWVIGSGVLMVDRRFDHGIVSS